MMKLLVTLAAVLLLVHGSAAGQNHTTLVIAVDLTQSVAVREPDGKSEFQKNIDAVTKQLAQAPADSRVIIIGITDRSFTQPNILLSATIPADSGYFGERLNSARRQLVSTWKTRSAKLQPQYRYTDIIGALLLVEQVFHQHAEPSRKILVIYSDMRHHTPDLNVESISVVPSFLQMSNRVKPTMPDLRGVRVSILGVDGSGKSLTYWGSLRGFWSQSLKFAGASLEEYLVLRGGSLIEINAE